MDTIRVERDEELPGLVTITLNRPDRLNAIDARMHEEIRAACLELRTDQHARVVLLTGAGRAFSAGADIKGPAAPPAESPWHARLRAEAGNRSCEALEALPQVTIGVVNGLAIGGAVVFLSCLDMRIAAADAWFSIPEVDLAIPLTWNALPRLMRELGPARTRELVMTCDRFSAEDALGWGFLNRICEPADLMQEARELARRILEKDELAIARTKAAVNALAQLMVPAQATYSDPDLLMRPGR